MARWRRLLVVMLGLLLGTAPALVAPASAATLNGYGRTTNPFTCSYRDTAASRASIRFRNSARTTG